MRSSSEFNVRSLSPYRVDSVIETLGIPSEDKIARQAVVFMHHIMTDECTNPNINRADNAILCNEMTFDKIERRYERYRLYKDYFFYKIIWSD